MRPAHLLNPLFPNIVIIASKDKPVRTPVACDHSHQHHHIPPDGGDRRRVRVIPERPRQGEIPNLVYRRWITKYFIARSLDRKIISFDNCMLQHMLVADWQAANAVIEFAIVKIEDVEARRAYLMARRLALLNA